MAPLKGGPPQSKKKRLEFRLFDAHLHTEKHFNFVEHVVSVFNIVIGNLETYVVAFFHVFRETV